MSSGLQVRDFVPVGQVAVEFLAAVSETGLEAGRPVIRNLGSGYPQTLLSFAETWWMLLGATGKLRPGVLPTRRNDVVRYVPNITRA
jgi:hypothetical protein